MSTSDALCEVRHTLNRTSVQCLLQIAITQTTVTKQDKSSPRKAFSPEIQALTLEEYPPGREANHSCSDLSFYYEI